eukprot:4378093-Prymnesium_polylepis.1
MQDVEKLALGFDKLGDGGLTQARRVREAKARDESWRSPDNPDHLKVKLIEADSPKEPERYEALLKVLESASDYEP